MKSPAKPNSPLIPMIGLAVLVLAAALVPWILGELFSSKRVEPLPPAPPPAAAAAPSAEAEKPESEIFTPPPKRPRRTEPAPAAPKKPEPAAEAKETAPEPASDDGPWIERLQRSLVSFGGDSPDIDGVLSTVADLLSERPPKKSGEAGMPNKVEVKLADREKSANVYVLSTGDARGERYDVTIDLPRGALPDELRDRFDKLLNCRFFIEVRGEGLPTDVRGAVRYSPVTEESRIGAPFVCGYSIGTYDEGQRLVPFVTEIVRETDETIGYRTSTDESKATTAPFADAMRLVDTVRPAFAK